MNEELIRRSDAIKALKREKSDWNNDYNVPIDHCIERLNKVKSADRPQGKWIGEADGYYNGELIYDTWYCSNCDYVVDDEEPPTWNFCPNCGARMKGKDNE